MLLAERCDEDDGDDDCCVDEESRSGVCSHLPFTKCLLSEREKRENEEKKPNFDGQGQCVDGGCCWVDAKLKLLLLPPFTVSLGADC